MSSYAATWAWTVDGITDRQRLALLALADNAGPDDDVMWHPGLLTKRLRITRTQETRILEELVRLGLARTRTDAHGTTWLDLATSRLEHDHE